MYGKLLLLLLVTVIVMKLGKCPERFGDQKEHRLLVNWLSGISDKHSWSNDTSL